MKKVRVLGVQILTPSMSFLTTFLNFLKLVSSLKAQVCNILKNYIDIQKILFNNTDFLNYTIHKWFLHKFHIFINKLSRTRTKVSPTVPNLPSNDEITRFYGTSLVPPSSNTFKCREGGVKAECT
jgi:hypothetical protein